MNLQRKIFSRIARPLIQIYLRNEKTYSYEETSIKILPGVFHPGLFFSTKFLLRYVESLDLKNKSLLELGAGNGLISFISEKNGAIVTASDLSQEALKGLEQNRKTLKSKITIIKSDVFEQIPSQQFDFIVINPPYYAKKVAKEWELAWNCGEDFGFYKKLFLRLTDFAHNKSKVIMVLSEDCDIFTIRNIAKHNGWNLVEQEKRKFWWEWNFIFECVKN
jgi:release factor glutamine methyltransferase